ncbi:PREDICTED: aspartic proteinase CDR1-like [Erythranthe guttata]|uniref:aspartic proteinase CDR1-like n=1 Tax=Erythranthe guttata TaxID=4155 RepID=UPI00064DD2B3|nr:PREDICTED: aspartic proteinase CDR1-like [Erythranthe guttata]|eukprot:XP_012849648.1 PREDICTED: aspartic proteinase CDR1-like [Erythranthe guttata]
MAETIMSFKSILIALISLTQCEAFTVDLIHRDSPHSPYYNPSQSHYQRLTSAVQRSFNRCQPCIECFNQTLPIFKPKSSSTYKTIPCSDRKCKSLYETSCSRTRKNCLYTETYGDGSFTNGLLATETITLDSSDGKRVSFPNLIFGCGFKNGGIFDGGESGIVGLGGETASLVKQLGEGMFSYCLIPLSDNKSSSSKLNFGDSARVSGEGVVTTPLVKKEPDTYYYLTLEGISIGSQRLGFRDHNKSDSKGNGIDGNVIIE